MATLAEMLRQGADKLINLPSEAQRFITNPQAFTQLLTGKNPLPRETGFAAGVTGLPAQEMSVLDTNQAPYMQGYTQGEPVGYAGMALPFAAPAATATAKALAPKLGQVTENYMVRQGMIQPLTAYHGTPHTIQGQFDIKKVGTGEGNQSYGHGMYFAENPDVATQYRKALSTPFKETSSASQLLDMANGNYDEALKLAQRNKNIAEIHSGKIEHIESANKTIDILNKMKNGEKLEFGNMYKVDIPDADIPMMLDYDNPIKNQPEILKKVRNLIKDPDILENFDKNVESGITGANVYANYIPTGVSKFDLLQQRDDLLNKYMTKDMGMSDAVKAMNAEDRFAFSEIAQKIDDLKNKPKLASQILNEAGIKGIRYLDQGSRGQGGTSNFVVFDPSTVKILEKNEKPVTRKELIQEQINKIE